MLGRSSTRPRHANQLAKRIVDIAAGEVVHSDKKQKPKNPKAVSLGRFGGPEGGKGRAEKLSPERRSEIARKAAPAGCGRG